VPKASHGSEEKAEDRKRNIKTAAAVKPAEMPKDKEKVKDNARGPRDSFSVPPVKKFKSEYISDSEDEKVSDMGLNPNFKRLMNAATDYPIDMIPIIKEFRKIISKNDEAVLAVIRTVRVKHNDFSSILKATIANTGYDTFQKI